MRAIVEHVQDTGFVLEGVDAFVFPYGAHRHTMDANLEAKRNTDMTRRIRRATQATGGEINEDRW